MLFAIEKVDSNSSGKFLPGLQKHFFYSTVMFFNNWISTGRNLAKGKINFI
jgi:hypothetical protein